MNIKKYNFYNIEIKFLDLLITTDDFTRVLIR